MTQTEMFEIASICPNDVPDLYVSEERAFAFMSAEMQALEKIRALTTSKEYRYDA